MTPPEDVAGLLTAIPLGQSRGRAHGRPYVVVRQEFNAGRSVKLVAEELGGTDYISLNFYDLARGATLNPCEMPAGKVIAFLRAFQLDPGG